MKIVLCETIDGTNNFICDLLKKQEDNITALDNNDFALGARHIRELLKGADVVINLTGEKLLKKNYSMRQKEEIYFSRVENTKILINAINGMKNPPSLLIMTTLVNIYDEINIHDEYSQNLGEDFLADMCKNWEKAAFKLNPKTRICIFRIGNVLSDKGGLFVKIKELAEYNFDFKIGNGKQSVPLIHVSDVLKAFRWSISNSDKNGIYNLVMPEIMTNEKFSYFMKKNFKRKKLFTFSKFPAKFFLREETFFFVTCQFVIPHRLLSDGFEFDFPTLESCINTI
ncbi:MAG: DUF1731 domain-containing protein [Marinilabiliaceae bacterium]|nr:DUF1731 domain-containing protein [Marinilabiliaceae bacterium]